MSRTQRIQSSLEKKSLHIFRELLALHDAKTMTAAARQLGMTLSTLARDLAEFHDGPVGETLLAPDGKGWKLTPRGHAALPAIRDLVRQYEQLLAFVTGDGDSPRVVRIGLGSFAAQHYFPQVMLATLAENGSGDQVEPPWRIETEVCRGRDRILGVFDGSLDGAIVSHTEEQVRGLLQETRGEALARGVELPRCEPLTRHPFCVIAAPKSPAGQTLAAVSVRSELPLKQLANVELVGLDPQSGIRRRIEERLRAAGREPMFLPGTGAGGWYAAKELARHGLGAALVPLAIMSPTDQSAFVLRHLPNELAIVESFLERPVVPRESPLPTIRARIQAAASQFARQTVESWSRKG